MGLPVWHRWAGGAAAHLTRPVSYMRSYTHSYMRRRG